METLGHITGDWRRWEEDEVEDEGEIEEIDYEIACRKIKSSQFREGSP